MKIAVVGMGKIGLPLAVQYARKGHDVVGVDQVSEICSFINQGQPPFPGEEHLEEYLAEVVAEGKLRATTDVAEAVSNSSVVVVVVPLVVDQSHSPDYSIIETATAQIGASIQRGSLITFETTLPVGTTRNRLAPILERESGLAASRDFFVAFSPERVLTGRIFRDLKQYPKLVGGLTKSDESRAISFYGEVLDFNSRDDLERANGVWSMGSSEAAEMAKLVETTYRDVNIGLANQFARYAELIGVDIYKVIEACNSQPYANIHKPGVAVGGHCIPVYPHLYLAGDPDASIVRAARLENSAAPLHAITKLESALGSLVGIKVVILGASYRGGVKELAFSGVWPLASELEVRGAIVKVHDPFFSEDELQANNLNPFIPGEHADVVVLQADHAGYASWGEKEVAGVKIVYDGRNFLAAGQWPSATHLVLGRAV